MSVKLPHMPANILALPRDRRGYPVPWFVEWQDDEPLFQFADARKRERAVIERLCWVCGTPLGANLAFVLGPMCGINRTSSEPPSHLSCAEFSVQACPFLNNPNANRTSGDRGANPAGIMIKRNPGISMVWITKRFQTFGDGNGGWLIHVGAPTDISFWREGRPATREEILASVEEGCPAVEKLALEESQAALDGFIAAKKDFLSLVDIHLS